MKHLLKIQVLLLIFVLCNAGYSQSEIERKYIFEGPKLVEIMENSPLAYSIEEYKIADIKSPNYYILAEPLQHFIVEDKLVLSKAASTDEDARVQIDSAEYYYKNRDFDRAIEFYKKALEYDSISSTTYTNLADMYYMKKDYEKAIELFQEAIKKNYYDYQAHWFLADTYDKIEDHENAVKEITIAHILNRNSDKILNSLKTYRNKAGREWKEFSVLPRYTTYIDSLEDKIIIKTADDWMGFALADALWKYEPGFAKSIIGRDIEENEVLFEKEASCFYANLASESMKCFMEALQDQKFDIIVVYEFLCKRDPLKIYLVSDEIIPLVSEYLEKYH